MVAPRAADSTSSCRSTKDNAAASSASNGGQVRRNSNGCKSRRLQRALQFLQRQQSLDPFLAFVRDQKLRGKLRAYCSGFPKYGEENWDEAQIAKDLRTTTDKVGAYRARLRDLIEEFELDRLRRRRT